MRGRAQGENIERQQQQRGEGALEPTYNKKKKKMPNKQNPSFSWVIKNVKLLLNNPPYSQIWRETDKYRKS